MLKLIKKEDALSKKELSATYGGSCGTMGCDCDYEGSHLDYKQDLTYNNWKIQN